MTLEMSFLLVKFRLVLQWEMPTKTFPTLIAITWLKQLVLPEVDRLELNFLLQDLKAIQQRLRELEKIILARCQNNENVQLLRVCSRNCLLHSHFALLSYWTCSAFSESQKPDKLLGTDAWVSQQRRE